MRSNTLRANHGLILPLVLCGLFSSMAVAQKVAVGPECMPGDTLAFLSWDGTNMQKAAWEKQLPEMIPGVVNAFGEEVQQDVLNKISEMATLACSVMHGRVATALIDVEADAQGDPIFHLVTVCDGAPCDNLSKAVQGLLSEGDPKAVREVKFGDATFKSVGDEKRHSQVIWGVHRDVFIVATSRKAIEQVLPTLGGAKIAALANNPAFALGAKVTAPAAEKSGMPGGKMTLFVNVRRGLEIVKKFATASGDPPPAMFDKIASAVGLDGVQSIFWRTEPSTRGARSHLFLQGKPGDKGILSLWKQTPVSDSELAILPQDAHWACITHCDLNAFWSATREAIENIDEQAAPQVEAAIATSRQFLGFSVTEDLLPALGDSWAFFDAPAHGGILMLGSVMVVNAAKPDALDAIIQRTVQIVSPLAANTKVNVEARKTTIAGRTINYVVIGGVPSPVVPAWTVVDGYFILGLYPQSVAAAADQVDTKSRKGSLLENVEFKAGRAMLNANAIGWGYTNSRELMKMMYPAVPMYGNMALSMVSVRGTKFDFGWLPSLSDWLANTHDSVGQCYTDNDGIHYVSVGSGGGWTAAAAPAAIGVSILLPSLSRARELAKRTVCMSNLRGIGQGCHIYANDHNDKFPDDFAALVKEGMCTPGMFVCPSSGEVEADPDDFLTGKNPKVSYVLIKGQSTNRDVRNVLAYEPLENHHEGGCILFLDGHAEFVKMPRFAEEIRATYKRLNRESEIPADLRE